MFDFHTFIESLKNNKEKKETFNKFENFFPGMLSLSLEDQNWFQNSVTHFQVTEYLVSEEFANDFNWGLLMQLVAGSFSSNGSLESVPEKSLPELIINVQSGDQVVIKKISELWGFQILRLYEIYIEELLNLQVLIATDQKESESIFAQREARIQRWKLILEGKETDKSIIEYQSSHNIHETISSDRSVDIICSSKANFNKTSLFDFHKFVKELRENDEKREVVEKFEKFYPNMLSKPLEKQNWVEDYIYEFKDLPAYAVPKELLDDFDWELLQMLLAGSFSSVLEHGQKINDCCELEVHVESGNQIVIKKISELWGFQILRLYKIYVEEQLNLQVLIAEYPKEKEAILAQRKTKLKRWLGLKSRQKVRELSLI